MKLALSFICLSIVSTVVVRAQTLTSTFQFTGSGTIGTRAFTNAAITITTVSNSPSVVPAVIHKVKSTSASVTLSGVGTFQFTVPTDVEEVVSQPNTAPGTSVDEGIGFGAAGTIYLVLLHRQVSNLNLWNLLSSVGPITSWADLAAWNVVPITTTGGTLNLYTTEVGATFQATYTGTPPPPPVAPTITQFTANPGSIQRGQSSTLSWQVTGEVTTVSINQWIGTVQPTGSLGVAPNDSTTYTLTATGRGGSNSRTATVNVTAPPPPTPIPIRVGVLSHIAAGGGWSTVITLVNDASPSVPVTVAFHDEDGNALSLPVTTANQGATATTTTSSVSATIKANGTLLISTEQLASTVVGWADVTSTAPVEGFAIFRTNSPNSPISEGTVPVQTEFPTTVTLPYDDTAGFVMGVALANLSTSVANITSTVWDESGNRLGAQSFSIAGGGHTSFVLPNQIALTAGRRGIVQFQSGGGLSGLGLRFSPFGTFTSVPTI